MNPTTTQATIDDTLAIDSDSTQRLFLEARTANSFSSKPVSADTLAAIYELTKMSPTMMNNQPLRITWVQSPEARERLASHLAEGNQSEALAEFNRYRALLRAELGLDPTPRLCELVADLQRR